MEFFHGFGITMNVDGNILAPWGEWVPLPLVVGSKTWAAGWSMLPGDIDYTVNVNGEQVTMHGTCSHTCKGGYCLTGHYLDPAVQDALAWRTKAAREYPEWLENAIVAQLMWGDGWNCEVELVPRYGKRGQRLKDGEIKHWSRVCSKLCRIHVTGDFFSPRYVSMWENIISRVPGCAFWAYTKETIAERLNALPNFNMVESILPWGQYNFGTIDEILAARQMLLDMGIETHICLCALDQKDIPKEERHHCKGCTACSRLKHVLFLKHGDRKYDPTKDPRWEELVQVLLAQKSFAA